MSRSNLGLYIHVPFCKAKCHYCDFNSFPGKDETIPGYFDALSREIENNAEALRDYSIKTVFIGGGTPSLVEPKYIYNLLKTCREYLSLEKGAEISIESNPGTLTYEKLFAYRTMGINRLSIGLQAYQNRLLRRLGRIHTNEEFLENYNLAKKVGFKNINVDLIFGIPSQTLKDWIETVEEIMKLEPVHLSCYSLKIEEDTEFGRQAETGELIPLEDETDREMYSFTIDMLKKNGFMQYEISNFSKAGFECRHNLIYWNAEEYVGIGAGAHSYFMGKRYNNIYNIEEYVSAVQNSRPVTENMQLIDKQEAMSEFMILGLRLTQGVSLSKFKAKFDKELFEIYGQNIDRLIKKELICLDNDFLRLTLRGLDLANDVFMEFI